MKIFNSIYSEVGSIDENLLLNTKGKIKIRIGNTFIDLLDDKGKINKSLLPSELFEDPED